MDFTKFCTTSRKRKEEQSSVVVQESGQKVPPVASSSVSAAAADHNPEQAAAPQNFDEFVAEHKVPIENQIDLVGHTKAVSCISVEPAGNRVVTGSYDYAVKIYDFGGMDSRHRAFQSIEAQENHMVVSISHSPSGDRFIVATGSSQPKVYDREGKELIKFVRGDMYLRDLSNTKGHTMEVTGVQWHPTEKEVVMTSSLDGSIRIWDLQGESTFGTLVNKHVLKVRGLSGANRLGLNSCCYSPNGKKMAGGAADGSVHIFNEKKVYSKADLVLRHDCCAQREITSVAFTKDGNTLAMRSSSGHVLLWDVRSEKAAKAPLKIFADLPNDYPTANIAFSPDGSLLCCGTSPVAHTAPSNAAAIAIASDAAPASSSQSTGSSGAAAPAAQAVEGPLKSRLYFFDLTGESTAPCLSIAVEAGATVIMVRWHPTTNQILCTMSSGVTRVFYDPVHSKKGALLSASKAPKRVRDLTDFAAVGEIYNPLALPMYRTEMPGDHKKRREELKDPYLAKIPTNKPAGGPGTRTNTSFFFTNHVMKDRVVDKSRSEDPREALLRVDAEARADPKIFGSAYATTQPKAQLHTMTFEEEQEEFKKKQKKL
jgi:glucose/arabinose dehydrogenase